jgi:hypothetical protein
MKPLSAQPLSLHLYRAKGDRHLPQNNHPIAQQTKLLLISLVIISKVAASDESSDRPHTKFPGVEAGGCHGDLLVVGVGLGAEADGGDARGEGDRE